MDGLSELLGWRLSSSGRVWGAVMPAVLILSYLSVGGVVFLIRNSTRGVFRDAEVSDRGSSVLLGMSIRQFFAWVTQPAFQLLRSTGLPAMALTSLSALLATAAGIAVGAGQFSLGGWLYILGGISDFFDGRLARAACEAGPRGAALDSVIDRYSDGAFLLGLGWYYRESWVLLAVGALMLASFMVSYVRARGEGLGVEVKVGLMQRPERIAYLGAAVALSPIPDAVFASSGNAQPQYYLAVVTITLLAIATMATAGHRLVHLIRALDGVERSNPWTNAERGTLSPFVTSTTVATIADFLVMLALVHHGLRPWVATFVACSIGAAVNITLYRWWSGARPVVRRQSRYIFSSVTSAGLNAGGVAVLMLSPLDFRIGWLLARGVVALLWNYPLNRAYLFAVADADVDVDVAPAALRTEARVRRSAAIRGDDLWGGG